MNSMEMRCWEGGFGWKEQGLKKERGLEAIQKLWVTRHTVNDASDHASMLAPIALNEKDARGRKS